MTDPTPQRPPSTELRVEKLEDRTNPTAPYANGRVLIGITPGADVNAVVASVAADPITSSVQALGFNLFKVNLKGGVLVPQATATIQVKAGVKFAEPDYLRKALAAPNDPLFLDGTKWSLNNTGKFPGSVKGADIGAQSGWDIGVGTGDHVIAVIDTGVDYTHPDLVANMWTGAGGTHGFDFINNDSDPQDDQGHGTNVAGIAGAVGNNGIGVTGVAWKTRIMAVKVLGADGSGSVSGIIQGVNFAVANGATVLNESLGGTGFSQAELDASIAAGAAGAIIVAAAANDTLDNDVNPHYPANFSTMTDNVVAVAATDWSDHLSFFSDWGKTTVQLGATGGAAGQFGPGDGIDSTAPGGGYLEESGTSQATPHVAGALIAFWDANPDLSYKEVLGYLYKTVRQLPDLIGKSVTGGVLDFGALMDATKPPSYNATGAGAGGGPAVKVFNNRGKQLASFYAYDPAFNGGVRTATGDINGDGIPDIVTAPGAGGGPHVKVYDGKTFTEIASFFAFESKFRGGLFVTTGDVDGDGNKDIIVSADASGGPRVSVFRYDPTSGNTSMVANFFAYDPGFTGGVRIAAGDVNGDGKADIITAPGLGGGPEVKAFDGARLLAGAKLTLRDLFVAAPTNYNGLFVAAGDFTGDKIADIAVSSGSGTPWVRVYNGLNLGLIQQIFPPNGPPAGLFLDVGGDLTQTANTTVFPNDLLPPATPPNGLVVDTTIKNAVQMNGYQFGVRIATQDVTRDGIVDLVLAAGPTELPRVYMIDGRTFAAIRDYAAYEDFFYGGVFIGGPGDVPDKKKSG